MRQFLEMEADLGSDNEDNERLKVIDRGDAEENEEGQDRDLDGFVVHGDDEEIGAPEDGVF